MCMQVNDWQHWWKKNQRASKRPWQPTSKLPKIQHISSPKPNFLLFNVSGKSISFFDISFLAPHAPCVRCSLYLGKLGERLVPGILERQKAKRLAVWSKPQTHKAAAPSAITQVVFTCAWTSTRYCLLKNGCKNRTMLELSPNHSLWDEVFPTASFHNWKCATYCCRKRIYEEGCKQRQPGTCNQ